MLAGLATVPVALLLPDLGLPMRSPQAATAGIVRSALHVHTSFSEGSSSLTSLTSGSSLGSMESQAATLASLGVDLVFFTDHDHRMAGDNFGVSPSPYPSREDMTHPHWKYTSESAGSTVGGSAATTGNGLEASVTSGTAQGWRGMFVDCFPTDRDYRTTLAGVSMGLTFTHSGSSGWTEMRIRTSYHPARGGRSAGNYEIHYYFNPRAATKSIATQARTAVVTIPVPAGQVHHAVVTPVADISGLS